MLTVSCVAPGATMVIADAVDSVVPTVNGTAATWPEMGAVKVADDSAVSAAPSVCCAANRLDCCCRFLASAVNTDVPVPPDDPEPP